MKAIFVAPNMEPFVVEFEHKLESLQSLVGGYIDMLSIKSANNRSIDIVFNDECKFLFEDVNKWIVYSSGEKDYLSGNLLLVAVDETTGEMDSLTDEEIGVWIKELSKNYLTVTY